MSNLLIILVVSNSLLSFSDLINLAFELIDF
jgi:hypothetical protein